ncbi:MAG: DUF4845 domain-containing protein [Porticoccaceae bacterium]|nr:DUF4845 domain-containing protein [Porticoccaceae bacterium]
MKINTRYHQQGISTLGAVVLLLLATFFLTIVFKVGPMYLDNFAVKGSFDGLAEENVRDMTDSDIRRKMDSYFIVNNVRNFSARDVVIKRERTKIVVSHDYETRANFMGNLDVVAVFSNKYDSSEH